MLIKEQLNHLSSSDALDLGEALMGNKKNYSPRIQHVGGMICYVVNPMIKLSCVPSHEVELQVYVSADWKKRPPKVFCFERWIRRELDWHVIRDGSFCWDHPDRWVDRCKVTMDLLSTRHACIRLASYLKESLHYLIQCHWQGAELGLATWHPSWRQFAHFESGTVEYAGERESFIKALRRQLLN